MSLQRLYIPKLIELLEKEDPESTELLKKRIKEFHPRLVLNMIDDPKDADRAQRIRRSCQQYLALDLEHLGVVYRDTMQDKALASRLPVIVYKPQSIVSQAIFRIAEKIVQSETLKFDDDYDLTQASENSFEIAAEEANDDFGQKMAYVEELAGTGALTPGELAETLRQQQFEITRLRNENNLLKKKILDAASQGFRV
jgi:flagellar biosynthesis protein FlhG